MEIDSTCKTSQSEFDARRLEGGQKHEALAEKTVYTVNRWQAALRNLG